MVPKSKDLIPRASDPVVQEDLFGTSSEEESDNPPMEVSDSSDDDVEIIDIDDDDDDDVQEIPARVSLPVITKNRQVRVVLQRLDPVFRYPVAPGPAGPHAVSVPDGGPAPPSGAQLVKLSGLVYTVKPTGIEANKVPPTFGVLPDSTQPQSSSEAPRAIVGPLIIRDELVSSSQAKTNVGPPHARDMTKAKTSGEPERAISGPPLAHGAGSSREPERSVVIFSHARNFAETGPSAEPDHAVAGPSRARDVAEAAPSRNLARAVNRNEEDQRARGAFIRVPADNGLYPIPRIATDARLIDLAHFRDQARIGDAPHFTGLYHQAYNGTIDPCNPFWANLNRFICQRARLYPAVDGGVTRYCYACTIRYASCNGLFRHWLTRAEDADTRRCPSCQGHTFHQRPAGQCRF